MSCVLGTESCDKRSDSFVIHINLEVEGNIDK